MTYPDIERARRPKSVARRTPQVAAHADQLAATAVPAPTTERPPRATRESCPANVAIRIFDKLFFMLKTRLRAIAMEPGGAASTSADHLGLQEIKARILECAAALDHVHAALAPNIVRLHQTERELQRVRAELSLAQADPPAAPAPCCGT